MRIRRQYQTTLDHTGAGRVDIQPTNVAMEWEIQQIPVNTKVYSPNCVCAIYHNDSYLHSTPIGSQDTATGPPYPIVGPGDMLTITWAGGVAGDQATATIWYTEGPAGTATGR